jgi:hypothetical protein
MITHWQRDWVDRLGWIAVIYIAQIRSLGTQLQLIKRQFITSAIAILIEEYKSAPTSNAP